MHRLVLVLSAMAILSLETTAAHATTIDFESEASGRGRFFTGRPDSPLTIGTATFSGGELLKNESGNVGDHTAVYGTALLSGGYTNPLHISFSSGVSGFSVEVAANGNNDSFTVADNLGDSSSMFLTMGSTHIFSLAGNGITSVTIRESDPDFDFAIDNANFSPGASAVPEPSAIALLGTGVLGTASVFGRKVFPGWGDQKKA